MEFRKLTADEIDVRVATVSEKGVSLLLYKDARVDQNILDESVGADNWQRKHEVINGNLFCNVGIRVKHDDGTTEWVWKQDVGVESYTEKEKGQASDSFKRACFCWGIGRELYTSPFIWVNSGDVKIEEKNGKKTTYDRFKVQSIEYTGGVISNLVIVNEKTKKVVFSMNGNKSKPKEEKHKDKETEKNPEYVTEKEKEILMGILESKGLSAESVFPSGIDSLTMEQYGIAVKKLGGKA